MSLKMQCHSKLDVTQNWMSLKGNVNQNKMSLEMECPFKWNFTKNFISLKIECHSKWNVIKNGKSFKMG